MIRRALALAFLLTVALATPADAHADLAATSPGDGSALDGSPRTIVLEFTEPVTVPDDGIVLATGGTGAPMSDVALDGTGRVVTATLRSPLAPGAYTVAWTALAGDDHVLEGTFSFSVAGSDSVAAPAQQASLTSIASAVAPARQGTGPAPLLAGAAAALGAVAIALVALRRDAAPGGQP